MKKIMLLTLFFMAAFVMPAYSDPSSTPFEILNEKLDSIQETLDSEVVPINEKVDTIQQTLNNEVVPRLDGTSLRIPISELPYTISEPGSYYLTGDLSTSSDGIIVNADNVTIDLMGFSLIGPGSGTYSGIYMVERSNVEIRNGTVKGFAGTYQQGGGINEWNGKGHRVINVRALSNGRGIYLGGINHLVKDCTVLENGSYGIAVGKGCTVTGNTVYGNGDRGISIYQSCTVTGKTCFDNSSDGIHADGSDSTITGNTVRDNGNGGIAVRSNCLVKNNTLQGNNPSNIDVTLSGNSIEENLVTEATYGVYFHEAGNFYANNRASGNGTNYAGTLPTGSGDGGVNVEF